MAWRIERWLEELFPGKDRVYEAYRHLPPRELVIVAGAVLDSALATLLERRFRDLPREVESFLGADGDGRAPAATFGARIQLALLLGILTETDASILRQLKNLRNAFAHRVNVDFCSGVVVGPLRSLYETWVSQAELLAGRGYIRGRPTLLRAIGEFIGKVPEAGEGLVLGVFTTYQALFHLLNERVTRVGLIGE